MPWHVRDTALIAQRRAVPDVTCHVPTFLGDDYAGQCGDMPWHVRDTVLKINHFAASSGSGRAVARPWGLVWRDACFWGRFGDGFCAFLDCGTSFFISFL